MNKNNRLLLCASGIFVCYFYFGILQEKITRGKYPLEQTGENGEPAGVYEEKYTYMMTLCFVQCLINYFFAKGMLHVWKHGDDKTPKIYNASSALTYLLAMICSNMALQWVPYPTQVVGKSAKPIPVMLLGVLIGRKSYPLKKYLFVLMIVIGVALFMFKDKESSKSTNEGGVGIGELLLLLSLIMDGLTGAVQERMRAEAAPTGQQMMKNMNAWACIFLSIPLLASREIFYFLQFVERHPFVLINIGMLALAGGLGQFFIFMTVSEFGPLPCSVVTTTRKFFTVLVSVVFFGNALSNRQWLGACAVFAGLFLDAYYSKKGNSKK